LNVQNTITQAAHSIEANKFILLQVPLLDLELFQLSTTVAEVSNKRFTPKFYTDAESLPSKDYVSNLYWSCKVVTCMLVTRSSQNFITKSCTDAKSLPFGHSQQMEWYISFLLNHQTNQSVSLTIFHQVNLCSHSKECQKNLGLPANLATKYWSTALLYMWATANWRWWLH
jgi:hypothetical protein